MRLNLLRNTREKHHYLITGMATAVASDDDARALKSRCCWSLQRNDHFGPLRDWAAAAELNAVLSQTNGVAREVQLGGLGLESYGLEEIGIDSTCAHTTRVG